MNQNNTTKNKIKLSVIVLFYFGERWIKECIQSLEKQSLSRSAYEIILVDNGGSTPSVNKYRGTPYTRILHFHKNLGFAGGNNKALAHAEGEFVLLMNQDVWVHFNCLEELMAAFEANLQAGMISANMLMISSNDRPSRYTSTHKTVGLYKLAHFGYASYIIQETDKNLVPVEFVSGNAMCFRKCMLDDVGSYLFDKRLKSYAEDLDLSIRVQNTNWKMYVRPKALVYHFHVLSLHTFWRQHFHYGRGAFCFYRSRKNRSIKIEPRAFYVNLMYYPLRQSKGLKPLLSATLMAVSQLANALGYYWEHIISK